MLGCRKDIRDYSKSHERNLIKRKASNIISVALRRERKHKSVLRNVENTVNSELFDTNKLSTSSIPNTNDIDGQQYISSSLQTAHVTCYNYQDEFRCNENKRKEVHEYFDSDIHSDDDPENSDESCSENENDIQNDLAVWAIHNGITHNALERLLKLLRKPNRYPQLPGTAIALLGNPSNGQIRPVEPGYYWHNGLKTCLDKLSEEITSNNSLKTILLSINIDGLPLFKSSSSTLYPILGSISCSKKIFVIGCYHGYHKPTDFNDFLKDFVDETIHLINTGYNCREKTYNIKIDKLICDAPAKAAVLHIMLHTGYYSCTKCTVKGARKLNRVFFKNTQATLRSDTDFLMQTQVEHHKGTSLLTSIPHFGPISNVPIDYMHMVCLGVMRKLLLIWLFGRNHLKQVDIDTISDKLLKVTKPCIPQEFCRKPRSLEYIKFWKATEFRQFLLYTGPIVLADTLPKEKYINFCVLHVAIRILCSPQLLSRYCDYASQLLEYFVQNFETIYGDYLVSHNVHGLIHLAADAEIFGVLDDFSAFKFENYLQQLKRSIRKASQPLQQLCRRYQELDYINQIEVQHKTTEIKLKFPFVINSRSHCSTEGFLVAIINGVIYKGKDNANGYCQLKDGTAVNIECFTQDIHDETYIIGKCFQNKEEFLPIPEVADIINVHILYNLSERQCWSIRDLKSKYILFPKSDKFVGFPLLHVEK